MHETLEESYLKAKAYVDAHRKTIMNMEPKRSEIVRKIFLESYRDLGVYRLMNRWSPLFLMVLGGTFFMGLGFAFLGLYQFIQTWFYTAFPVIVIGGFDHFLIGLSIKRALNTLSEGYSIEITKKQLLDICKDILPK